MTRAILFDMDGVIVDSMAIHAMAWQKAIEQHTGIVISHSFVYEREGKNSAAFIRDVGLMYQLELSDQEIQKIDQTKSEIFLENHTLKRLPGIETLVKFLFDLGYRLGIATGSTLPIAQRALSDLGFEDYFSVIVTAEDVKNGKPDPQPYELLLERLGGLQDQALVIENAPLGVQSARAAGLFCIAVTTTNSENVLEHASVVLKDLYAVLSFLEEEYRQSQGSGPWQFNKGV